MIPKSFRAGVTTRLVLRLSQRSASEGWNVMLALHLGESQERVVFTESATNPGSWEGQIGHTISENWEPGSYRYFVVAENDQAREIEYEGMVEILPDPLSAPQKKTALENELKLTEVAITAVLEGKGVKSYTIDTQVGRRELTRMTLAELRSHKAWVEGRIAAYEERTGQKKRAGNWRNVGVKFS